MQLSGILFTMPSTVRHISIFIVDPGQFPEYESTNGTNDIHKSPNFQKQIRAAQHPCHPRYQLYLWNPDQVHRWMFK